MNENIAWALSHHNAQTVYRGDVLLGVIWPDRNAIRKGAYVAWTGDDTVILFPSKGHATDDLCGGVQGTRECTIRKVQPRKIAA